MRSRWPLALAGVIVAAVVLRLIVVVILGDHVWELPGISDQVSYDTLARRVLSGYGFTFPTQWWPATSAGEPTAHWSYLYTLYLAGVYALAGPHPMAARALQAIIVGAAGPLLVWRIGRRLFDARVALVGAGLYAGYGYFVYYAGALMTESFYIVAILWALDLAMAIVQAPSRTGVSQSHSTAGRRTGSVKAWLLLGMALGVAVLLRQLVLLFVPFLFGWVMWATGRHMGSQVTSDEQQARRVRQREVLGGVVLTSVVIAALIAPWTVRNYQAFGRFVLLNTNAGFAFFWGNHPIHGTRFVPLLPAGTYQQLIPPELRRLNEGALDQALLREGLRTVAADPVRFTQLSLSRAKDYFVFWPSADSSLTSNVARVLSFGVYVPFMLYGLAHTVLRRSSYDKAGRWPGIVLVYLFIGVYSAVHLLSWTLIRYRLPVDAVLMPFAALAIVEAVKHLSRVTASGCQRMPASAPS